MTTWVPAGAGSSMACAKENRASREPLTGSTWVAASTGVS